MNLDVQNVLVEKVDYILQFKLTNPCADSIVLEQQIDKIVYELYGLTEEEIKIIEGEVTV